MCTVVKLPSLIDNLHRCFSILVFSTPLKERRREEERKEKCTSRTLSRNGAPERWKVHELFNETVLRFYQRTVEFFLWQLFVPASFTTGAPRRNARRNPALHVSPYYPYFKCPVFPGLLFLPCAIFYVVCFCARSDEFFHQISHF